MPKQGWESATQAILFTITHRAGGCIMRICVSLKDGMNDVKVARHTIPEKEELNQPTIRHPDLSPSNIFISPSGEITGLVDWQYSAILPVFLQAKIPRHFQNYGDEDSENFRPPKLPENLDALTEDEKERETELYRQRQLHYFYLGSTSYRNKPHFHAMGTHDLVGGVDQVSLKAELVRASTYWPNIANSAMKQNDFPIKYSDVEVKECLEIDAEQKNADSQMQRVRNFIGVNIDGWVPNEQYEEAREKERLIKEQMLESTETEEEKKYLNENWPFQDHDELD